jgi:hypothetical protein
MVPAAEPSLNGLPKSLSPEFGAEIALAQYRRDRAGITDTESPANPGRKFQETGKKRES